jgi:hypothetical protein
MPRQAMYVLLRIPMRWGELVILGVMVVPLNLNRFEFEFAEIQATDRPSDQRPSETLSALLVREREIV